MVRGPMCSASQASTSGATECRSRRRLGGAVHQAWPGRERRKASDFASGWSGVAAAPTTKPQQEERPHSAKEPTCKRHDAGLEATPSTVARDATRTSARSSTPRRDAANENAMSAGAARCGAEPPQRPQRDRARRAPRRARCRSPCPRARRKPPIRERRAERRPDGLSSGAVVAAAVGAGRLASGRADGRAPAAPRGRSRRPSRGKRGAPRDRRPFGKGEDRRREDVADRSKERPFAQPARGLALVRRRRRACSPAVPSARPFAGP